MSARVLRRWLLLTAAGVGVCVAAGEASTLGSCAGRNDLGSFTIRSARVSDPFWFLRWRKLPANLTQAVQQLAGTPYRSVAVQAVSQQIEDHGWLPNSPDELGSFSYSDIVLENCADSQLDVVFHIFSARIGANLSTVIDTRPTEKTLPSQAMGISGVRPRLQLAPEAGYDAARNFQAGGRLEATLPGGVPFAKLRMDGRGSTHSRSLTGALQGEFNSFTSWLGHADWRLEFQNTVQPAANSQIAESRLALSFAGATKPRRGVVARFGGALNGGVLQSGFRQSDLNSTTVNNSRYTSAKLSTGVSGRANHQAYAISYGLALGSTERAFHGDWSKHIADLSHELWLPVGDHRLFEWEQRLNLGGIAHARKIPAAQRFFGGNAETPFVDFDTWKIRANPVIRSIPYNRLAQTASGLGGDSFFSYNSTIGITAWRKPVVPKDLTEDRTFQLALRGQVKSSLSILQVYYSAKDAHFTAIQATLPALAGQMEAVKTAKAAVEPSAPSTLQPLFAACQKAWSKANMAVKFAVKDKPTGAYGWVQEMLPDGDNPLAGVHSACTPLADALQSAGIDASALRAAIAQLNTTAQSIAAGFAQIDTAAAQAKAAADFQFVDRTLNTITREMNISSISPVFLFDMGRIAPAGSPGGGNRYALGGGIRFSLVSTASFTFGYAVNPQPRTGESRGAFFFTLTTRNLFE